MSLLVKAGAIKGYLGHFTLDLLIRCSWRTDPDRGGVMGSILSSGDYCLWLLDSCVVRLDLLERLVCLCFMIWYHVPGSG